MPTSRRTRLIAADREAIWSVVADPHHLARWWPRAQRIEDVRERKRGTGTQWTMVFRAASGRDVRADFRCTYSRRPELYGWEQEIVPGSPFAKMLRSSGTRLELADADGGTRVTIEQSRKLKGINRLGGFIVRGATKRQLAEALDGLERATGADSDLEEAT